MRSLALRPGDSLVWGNVKRLVGIAGLIACVALAGAAHAALLKTGNLMLEADGGFTPRKLPRRAYAPIDFKGHANIMAVDGGIPAPPTQIVIDFDHDGRPSTRGVATCDSPLLRDATVDEGRAICARAVVGTGLVEALIAREGQPPMPVSSPLTLFNGPPQEGHPTVVLHARTTEPAVQTLVVTIPIERRAGAFRYRATIDLPTIAVGRGALTHIDVDIGRRYRFGGKKRSYVSARCRDGILSTHGRFTFSGETAEPIIVAGAVEKPCTVR